MDSPMLKIRFAVATLWVALLMSSLAHAFPAPLTKEQCLEKTGTAWDEALSRCVWDPLKKEGCTQLAGMAWDDAQSKCIKKTK